VQGEGRGRGISVSLLNGRGSSSEGWPKVVTEKGQRNLKVGEEGPDKGCAPQGPEGSGAIPPREEVLRCQRRGSALRRRKAAERRSRQGKVVGETIPAQHRPCEIQREKSPGSHQKVLRERPIGGTLPPSRGKMGGIKER